MQPQGTTLAASDVKLVADIILKAVNLAPGEAFDIGGSDGIIVARSSSGKLRVGHGGINCGYTYWWRKGDPHENLADACRGSLDWTKMGYFARDFREACQWTLTRPAVKVSGIGRKHVRPVEPVVRGMG